MLLFKQRGLRHIIDFGYVNHGIPPVKRQNPTNYIDIEILTQIDCENKSEAKTNHE